MKVFKRILGLFLVFAITLSGVGFCDNSFDMLDFLPAFINPRFDKMVEWVKIDPVDIFINQPATVTITAKISPNPALISTSVNLFRITSGVATSLGKLYDDKTNGDSVANDNIFTSKITINEAEPRLVFFQISVNYKGDPKILVYEFTANVKVAENPEEVRSIIVTYLQAGNIESAITKFKPSNKLELLKSLDNALLAQLGEGIKTAQLIEYKEDYRIYIGEWMIPGGIDQTLKFMLYKDQLGQWKINIF
jgi:hypothetical protein